MVSAASKKRLFLAGLYHSRRQPFQSGHQASKQTGERAGLAAGQFEHIGIFFCGIRLEPVEYSSDIETKPYSMVEYRINPSAARLRRTATGSCPEKDSWQRNHGLIRHPGILGWRGKSKVFCEGETGDMAQCAAAQR